MYNTSFAGSQIIRLDTVDSTNDYATKLIKETKVFDGTVIVAKEQTSGKGQRGNSWVAEPAMNLTLSLIIYPKNLDLESHYILSQITALAVSDLLLVYGIDNEIKWPNDIFTKKGKIAGILIENTITNNRINYSIIGLGLNVNQVDFASLNATSMFNLSGEKTELDGLLKLFCGMFDKWYLMLTSGKPDYIHNTYLTRLLNFGKAAKYTYQNNVIEACILNVEKNGLLVLETAGGKTVKADLKEISYVF